MVRLKEEKAEELNTYCLNFNSTMVRLKADTVVAPLACGVAFQFHYGTIKRRVKLKPKKIAI